MTTSAHDEEAESHEEGNGNIIDDGHFIVPAKSIVDPVIRNAVVHPLEDGIDRHIHKRWLQTVCIREE